MAIMTNSCRIALAKAIKAAPLYVAWGTGDAAWGRSPPREERNATGLTHEIGRRPAAQVIYCLPDANGELVLPNQRFAASNEATPNLYLKATFEFDEGLGETIRELGIFIDTKTSPGLPAGQRYFTPSQLASSGTLLSLSHIAPQDRGVGSSITFHYVLCF